MKILSIDLPWSSSSGTYGFAWLDSSASARAVATAVQEGPASEAERVLSTFASRHGTFDLILVDQPIGGAGVATAGYRPVERAFGNSAFLTNGTRRIQAPRFQPGAPHAANGLTRALLAAHILGDRSAVVVESFPQLSILPLVDHALRSGRRLEAVSGLATHKKGGPLAREAGRQLAGSFIACTSTPVAGPAMEGHPDAVDALVALLPALAVLSPMPDGPAPCWLHSTPPGRPAHPSEVSRSGKSAARALWMSPLLPGRIGPPGVRSDGILSLRLPGWPSAEAAPREL
jgi:hypothetical protein